jgi:regulator of cell morphogenesis and NO signaling
METIERYEGIKVGEIVKKKPKAAGIFSAMGIDFCCGGNVLFTDVCKSKELDSQVVWQKLIEASENTSTGSELNFDSFDLAFLADYIVNVHHQYLYKNLPEVRFFVDKVFNRHGERFVYLPELYELYNALEADLVGHLPKEENILFPFVKQMVHDIKNNTAPSSPFFGTVNNPIHIMHSEHEEAGTILHRLREITHNYTAPEEACNSHLVMLDKLKDLDRDLIQHIHLENNILFPKIINLEEKYLAQ